MSSDRYQSPLSERYASKEMQYISRLIRNSGHGEGSGLLSRKRRKSWDSLLQMNRLRS